MTAPTPVKSACLVAVVIACLTLVCHADEWQKKLQALEAARAAGILSEEEYAAKKKQVEAQRAAQHGPSEEVKRKLTALDAAMAAGIISQDEHARKRRELLGAGAARPETVKAKADPKQRAGTIFRHPLGFQCWRPKDWSVQGGANNPVLVPPDPKRNRFGLAEYYAFMGDTAEGITQPDDPRIVQYFQQGLANRFPFLRPTGRPKVVPVSSGKGAILTWEGVQPQLNKPYVLQVFVTLLRGWGVALVAVGEKDAVMAREKDLRAIFDSFGCTEGKVDRNVVGAWNLVAETSIWNKSPFETDISRARAVASHKTTLTLNADGNFVRVYKYHMIALGAGVGLESKDEKISRGRWSASGGKLYLVYQDQKWSSFDYRLKQSQGGRELRLVDGKRLEVWQGK